MDTTKLKILAYALGICVAIYVTGLRLFTFIFELGLKTSDTDNIRNFLIYNLPDFISVVFCFTYILFFYKKIRQAIQK